MPVAWHAMQGEQQQRFEQDNRKRAARGLPQHPIDQNLIEALKVENSTGKCCSVISCQNGFSRLSTQLN